MKVEFKGAIKKGDDYVDVSKHRSPTEILQMQPMPAGYYAVDIVSFEGGPRAIEAIDPVVFIAICRFENKPEPVTCYAVQKPDEWGLKWFPEDQVNLHAHGAYIEACKLVGQQPLSFVEWVKSLRQGDMLFNIPVEEPAHSATPATTPPQES